MHTFFFLFCTRSSKVGEDCRRNYAQTIYNLENKLKISFTVLTIAKVKTQRFNQGLVVEETQEDQTNI